MQILKIKRILYYFPLVFLFTGCFELIEDLSFNEDGSGSYKLTLNLSASSMRVKSVLAMDSLRGRKVPSQQEIEQQLHDYADQLAKKSGIRKAEVTVNHSDLIVKVHIDFDDISALQKGISSLSNDTTYQNKYSNLFENWFEYDGSQLTRNKIEFSDQKWKQRLKEDDDYHRLREAKCVFIHRFPRQVQNTTNPAMKISKDGKNTMLQVNPKAVLENDKSMSYQIKLKD